MDKCTESQTDSRGYLNKTVLTTLNTIQYRGTLNKMNVFVEMCLFMYMETYVLIIPGTFLFHISYPVYYTIRVLLFVQSIV